MSILSALSPLAAIIGSVKKNKGKASDSGSASPSSFKRGDVVKKTGMAKVHKGERVLTKKQRSKGNYRKG